MLALKLFLFLVITIFIAIFSTQNNIPITINFFQWQSPELSLVIIIFSCILVGFIWALIPASIRIVSLKNRAQKLEDYLDIKNRTKQTLPKGKIK